MTYNPHTKEKLGEFCADAGLVAVADLSEVKAYNPDDETFTDDGATVIKDFDGDVRFVVRQHKGFYSFTVHVEGRGTNFVTGEPIEFRTKQID